MRTTEDATGDVQNWLALRRIQNPRRTGAAETANPGKRPQEAIRQVTAGEIKLTLARIHPAWFAGPRSASRPQAEWRRL